MISLRLTMRHSRTDIIAETEKLNLLFDFMERELRRDDIDFQGAMLGEKALAVEQERIPAVSFMKV